MKERPILFSAPMIRALLDGRKTQTRRICNPRGGLEFFGGTGQKNDPECWGYFFDGPEHHGYMVLARGLHERYDHGRISLPCPYGEPGDALWVKETFATHADDSYDCKKPLSADIYYRATSVPELHINGWRPSIFMPRWASRLTLEVTGVRVERLQAITPGDAMAEGIEYERHGGGLGDPCDEIRAVQAYETLWDAINGKRAAWASNPWVFVVCFRRLEACRAVA